MRSRVIGWDQRFVYIEQSMWQGGDCASHILIRAALIGPGRAGLVAPAELARAIGVPPESPVLPGWAQAWIAADAARPWPPQV